MRSNDIPAFHRDFKELIRKYDLESFALVALIPDGVEPVGFFQAHVANENPRHSSLLVLQFMENAITMMAKMNGLPPSAGAGALHGLVEEALDSHEQEMLRRIEAEEDEEPAQDN